MTVVALVPAKDRADSVAATVQALRELDEVDEVLVVDDGSIDDTAAVSAAAGAEVLRLPFNVGKGGAVRAGIDATPEADVYLLIDADLGSTAARAQALLPPVLSGQADLSIAVLPSAGGRGGFGAVRRLAAAGVLRATGQPTRAPLSGQRAVLGPLLRSLTLGDRFGLETAMTIDARRAGARVVEVDVEMDHRHTGRSLAGFGHRARQGIDVARALWPRLTSEGQRVAAILLVFAVLAGAALWSGSRWEASSVPLASRPTKVVVFGVPHLGFADLEQGLTPNLERLIRRGAVAAMSVRTLSRRPSSTEAYASLGAGTRVRVEPTAQLAFSALSAVEGGNAAEAVARRSGRPARGEVVVLGGPAAQRFNRGRYLTSEPGALGDALHAAGLKTAVVGNADNLSSPGDPVPALVRPAAIAVMDRSASVDFGTVEPQDLLMADPGAPFGFRADPGKVLAATDRALGRADVVVVDPGDLDRVTAFRRLALASAARAEFEEALRRSDALLGQVEASLPSGALLFVAAMAPPASSWHVTPIVAAGPGVPRGYLHSPSTKRLGVVTVTDLAPTILEALGAPVPKGMIGHAFRYHPGESDLAALRRLDRDTQYRERYYFPLTVAFIAFQALLYVVAMLAFSRRDGQVGMRRPLRLLVLGVAAFPLATFLLRAVPGYSSLGGASVVVLLGIIAACVAVALRARRHPLSPFRWILLATAAVIMVDVATGTRLHTSSILGWSLHGSGRFYGLPNTTFAVLAACSVLAACIHVHQAPRRREALTTAGAFLTLVVVVDGAPSLGNDVGGILTLVPLFGLTLLALSGRRLSWRSLLVAAGVTLLVLSLAAAVDLLRPPEARTHLGRFVTDLRENGLSTLGTTIARKQKANLRILGGSVWTWSLPAAALFMIHMLVWERRWQSLLPPRSPLRYAVVSALGAGLLGFLTNDSGPVVIGLVFVFVGPLITLLALEPQKVGPPDQTDPPAPPPPGQSSGAPPPVAEAAVIHTAPP